MKSVSRETVAMRAELFFVLYQGMGPNRSLARLRDYAASVGIADLPHLKTIRRWSADGKWSRRIAEINDAVKAETQARAIDAQIAINERQAVLGRGLQNLGARIVESFRTVPAKQEDVSARDAAQLIKVGADLERIASGLATSRAEILVGVWSVVIDEIAALFLRVNGIDDPEERKGEFAHGFDEVARAHVAGLLSPAREEG